MDAITLEEIKAIIGGLFLESKLQANRIRSLEAEVARLRGVADEGKLKIAAYDLMARLHPVAEADGGEIKEPPG